MLLHSGIYWNNIIYLFHVLLSLLNLLCSCLKFLTMINFCNTFLLNPLDANSCYFPLFQANFDDSIRSNSLKGLYEQFLLAYEILYLSCNLNRLKYYYYLIIIILYLSYLYSLLYIINKENLYFILKICFNLKLILKIYFNLELILKY